MLEEIGIHVEFQDDTHIMIFCPFHNNRHSAACSVAKDTGYYYCHGAGCDARGKFIDLLKHVKNWDTMRCMRFIEKHSGEGKPLAQVIEEIYATREDMPEFPAEILAGMQEEYSHNLAAQKYIASRGIKPKTAEYFGLGYDSGKGLVVVPMYDTNNRPIGVIGRSIAGPKRFKNSKKLPSKKSLYNIQNAKRAGSDTLVLVESSFDAIRVHQSGYPNVCATLGSTYSDYHLTQVNRHFNRLILMTDADEPGLAFADKIAKKTREAGTSVYRGRYSECELFPNGAKDCCDMTDEDIAWCIRNAGILV